MIQIDTLTQGYDAVEDRLFIDVRDAAGAVLRLWLTRRLADAVFGHLCDWLQRSRSRGDAGFDQLLHSWDQQAAQAGLRSGEPVRWQGEAVLLVAVDFTQTDQGCQLVFKTQLAGQQQPVAAVTFTLVQLRQWLGIVHRLYAPAGWPEDIWPDWLHNAVRAAEAAPTAD